MIKPQIAVLPLRAYRITILIKMNTIDAFRISSSNVINDFLRSSTRSSSVGFYKSMIKIRKTAIGLATKLKNKVIAAATIITFTII